MKINWKRVVIGAIWSELVLFAIWIPARLYGGSARQLIAYLDFLVLMFLGGLWVAHKLESRFALHGVLLGVIANVLAFPLLMLAIFIWPDALQLEPVKKVWVMIVFECALKILGSAAGAYVGGRLRKKSLAQQA
jgi:hypothetical protein